MSRATASEGRPDGPGRTPLAPPPHAASPVRHPEASAPGALLGPHYDHCFGCGEGQPHDASAVGRTAAAMADPDRIKVVRAFEVNP